jgi:hypothetical protein
LAARRTAPRFSSQSFNPIEATENPSDGTRKTANGMKRSC